MAGTIKANAIQLGDSVTATQNFVLLTNVDGTAKLARGNQGSTTQDLLTVAADGNVNLTKTTAQSMVRVNTSNGYGSTNTCIIRYTNIVTNQGSDITYADSATLGGSFTINTPGVYAVSGQVTFAPANSSFGISLNSSQLTTSIASITTADRLCFTVAASTSGRLAVSSCLYLPSGSVIRAHADATALVGVAEAQFTITRVA